MANKILIKRSNVADKEPVAADLEVGEIALNMADSKIYFKDPSNVIKVIAGGGGGGSVDVVDDLLSTSATQALSANQGRVLKEHVDTTVPTMAFGKFTVDSNGDLILTYMDEGTIVASDFNITANGELEVTV